MTRRRFASRMMLAQAVVIGSGAVALAITAWFVAPALFHDHLAHLPVDATNVQFHAEEAFASSFTIAVFAALAISLLTAALVSWVLVRRVSRPIEDLARSAHEVASGRFDVAVPQADFSAELQDLSASFGHMARRLGDSEAARTRLLADLAHELRTPLATLEAYLTGMEDEVIPADAEAWRTMQAQLDRLARLAADLKEVAAAQEHALDLHPEEIDAREVASTAVAAAAPRAADKGIVLRLEADDRPAPVRVDVVRIQQVLANLLDNAMRHTPTGRRILVIVQVDQGGARIDVVDDGDGIPTDQLDAIFDRFHRVDPARRSSGEGGSGLGLTIARAIAIDHAGSLVAVSDGLGTGATLRLTLPLSGSRAASSTLPR